MPPRLAATAAFVALLWAGNFVVTQAALDAGMTSLLLVAARFAVASSLVLAMPRPAGIGLSGLALIGLALGLGQFGLATLAMQAGLTPGITSLVLQTQCLATMGLASLVLGERLSLRALGGAGIALLGLGGLVTSGAPSRLGLALAGGAALAAAAVNILIKRLAPAAQPVRLAVWVAPFPILPLLALSCVFEASPLDAIHVADPAVLALAVVYGGLVSTVAGTALWTCLLHCAAASKVAPFTLLVPVFSALLSACAGGPLPGPGAALPFCVVLAGLAIAQSGSAQPGIRIAQLRPGRS